MPTLDGDDRVVGVVLREHPTTGNYIRSYLVLDFSTHKLRMYPEQVQLCTDLSQATCDMEINCQYITKVGGSSTRPKVLNSLEIVTTNGSYFLSVDSLEERDEWAESIRKASMRQGSAKQVVSFIQQKKKDVSYQTKIVAGVVHKIPIKTEENSAAGGGEESDGAEQKGVEQVGGANIGVRRTRGFPRIIKAGHAIKLGYVRKNWKKRFFVLTEISLGYYKSIDELEPIKTVSVAEITSVTPFKDSSGKDNMFQVATPNRTFYVQVESKQEYDDWLKGFNDLLSVVKPAPQHVSSHYTDHTPLMEEQVQSLSLVDSDDDEEQFGTLV